MSTSRLPKLPIGATMGKQAEIRQKLKEREAKIEEMNTKSYLDEPCGVAVGPDGKVVVLMGSGRVWSTDGGPWKAVGWGPVPDSTARETFDEFLNIGRELKALGYVEED